MVLRFFPALTCCSGIAGPEETKNQRGKCPPPDSDSFSDAEFDRNLACLSRPVIASANRRFQFQKRAQLSSERTFLPGLYTIKLTANSCIALCECHKGSQLFISRTFSRSPTA